MSKNNHFELDFPYLLLEYSKELLLSEENIVVLLMLDHILKQQPNTLITLDQLRIKLNMKTDRIDTIINNLTKMGLISHVFEGKNMYTTLDPTYRLLKEKDAKAFLNIEAIDHDQEKTTQLENIYQYFEKALKRPLTSIETNQIYNWLAKYSEVEIIDALLETQDTRKKHPSIKNVDKTLLDRAIKGERKREGKSVLSQDSNLTLKEAAEAVKIDWLSKD